MVSYTNIEQAFGGVSGSNMLRTPIKNNQHSQNETLVQYSRQRPNKRRPIKYKTDHDLYQCSYYGKPCEEAYKLNKQFNQENKNIVAGIPPEWYPYYYGPYSLLPQYPWYQAARDAYLSYGPNISQDFYQNPWAHYPHVAEQLQRYQEHHPNQYTVPIGPYKPVGFFPPSYYQNSPQNNRQNSPQNSPQNKKTVIEHFETTDKHVIDHQNMIKNVTILFVFFLIVLSVILCIFLLAFAHSMKK